MLRLEARGKPSTWFPRGWPVETERFSQFENSDNYCTIDIWSASQFARAPPLARNTKITHQPNPQCSDWSTSSLSTRPMWNLTSQHESRSHRRMHIVGVNFAFIRCGKKIDWRRIPTANRVTDCSEWIAWRTRIILVHNKIEQQWCTNVSAKRTHRIESMSCTLCKNQGTTQTKQMFQK